jgi:hypothetical protein
VDIIVSSENTFFQMSQTFKPSISGRLRDAAARKDPSGRIIEDVAQNELSAWMRAHQVDGREVPLGAVAPTSAGALEEHGIRRIYHAAAVRPIPDTNHYFTNPRAVTDAATAVFDLARKESKTTSEPLSSICFPLLGAGRGRLEPLDSIRSLFSVVKTEVGMDRDAGQPWTLHFISWKQSEAKLILDFLESEKAKV